MFDFIVAQKHVPEIQACKFFHQIIDGVEVLHNNDITHRDLKPEVKKMLFLICWIPLMIVSLESFVESINRRLVG